MSEMVLGTGMFRYKPLKSKEVMLISVCRGQYLNARLALCMTVSVSGHIVLTGKVRLGYFTKRLRYNSFSTLLIT
jgi:hypothetical protein